MDSKDTIADLHRVKDQPWAFNGPYRVPKMDLMISKHPSGFSLVQTEASDQR